MSLTKAGSPAQFILRCRHLTPYPIRKPFRRSQSSTQPQRTASTASPRSPFPSAHRQPSKEPPSPPGRVYSNPNALEPTSSNLSSIWGTLKRRLLSDSPPPSHLTTNPNTSRLNGLNNPWRARKRWPPNFSNLHPKSQFKYEKTYRRRYQLKTVRPGWIMGVKLVQMGMMGAVVVTWLFFMEVEGENTTMFKALLKWGFGEDETAADPRPSKPPQSPEEIQKEREGFSWTRLRLPGDKWTP